MGNEDFMMGRMPNLAIGPNSDKPMGGILAIFGMALKLNLGADTKGWAGHLDKASAVNFAAPQTSIWNSRKQPTKFETAAGTAFNDIKQNAASVRIEGPQIEGLIMGGSNAGGGFTPLATPSSAGGGRGGGRNDV